MKSLIIPILISLLISSLTYAEQEIKITDEMFYKDKYVLILKSTKDYSEAVRFATEASKKLGLEFHNVNRKYSKEKGIYFSEEIDDEMYRGGYAPRRYNGRAQSLKEYISLENSDYYKGFNDGYIIVVSGIYEDKKSSEKALAKIRKFYKDAYAKKTVMWMGCIH